MAAAAADRPLLVDAQDDEAECFDVVTSLSSLPTLVLSAVVLPVGLFRNNAHRTTLNKLLLWTPSVPLIMFQCLFRACVLLSTISSSSDKVYATIQAVEALILVPQVAVFLLMDSMRYPTPALRIGFAIALVLRFFAARLAIASAT